MSMLIDWSIKYDIYASFCVVKHCGFAAKTGKGRTVCTVLDYIIVLISVVLREAPPTVLGQVCTAIIHGWVGGGSHLIELTNYKRCLSCI